MQEFKNELLQPLSECVKLPPLAAIGPAVSGRLPDEGYTEKTFWLSSPIPGFRTQQELDPNRKRGLKDKNSLIYRKNSGLIPKVTFNTNTFSKSYF